MIKKGVVLRKAIAGKKVSELSSEKRELHDSEFATAEKPLEAPEESDQIPKG